LEPRELKGKKILYGCLDWGNGHVARSIPLIRELCDQGNSITLWCSQEQQRIFRNYDLDVQYHIAFEQDFKFTGDGNFKKEMLRNAFRWSKAMKTERKAVKAFVEANGTEMIISDHRYGLISPDVHSVFVTHQVRLPPKSGFIAQWMHKKWMKAFSEIWIMDTEEDRLAWMLSLPLFMPGANYIGHYSRFSDRQQQPAVAGKIVAIISGPEPYAEQLYKQLLTVASGYEDWTFVSGKDYPGISHSFPVIRDWREADEAIAAAEYIVSRNGYSTLMDLTVLRKKAILIPTPGQLEQLYLANAHIAHESWEMCHSEDAITTCLMEMKMNLLDDEENEE